MLATPSGATHVFTGLAPTCATDADVAAWEPPVWGRSHRWEAVTPLRAFEADLGMTARGEVRRQLERDLPRSVVLVDGRRVLDADAVLGATRLGRLCTQAALAPAVEQLLRAGLVAHERPYGGPMIVHVRRGGDVDVVKSLGVRDWRGSWAGTLQVALHADVAHGMVLHRFCVRRDRGAGTAVDGPLLGAAPGERGWVPHPC